MTNAPGPNESALAAAIQRVTADTRGLVQDQVDLAKVELQQKAAVFGRGTVIAVAAGLLIWAGRNTNRPNTGSGRYS